MCSGYLRILLDITRKMVWVTAYHTEGVNTFKIPNL